MGNAEGKKPAGKPNSIGADRLSKLPVEIFDTIGSYLNKKDVLKLRQVSRTVQEKTTRSFSEKFLRCLVVNAGRSTSELAMVPHFLSYPDMARTVKELYVFHHGSHVEEAEVYLDFFAEVMEKIPAALEKVTIDVNWTSPAPSEVLQAMVESKKKVACLALINIRVEYSLLQALFAAHKQSLHHLKIEKCMLLGGTWDLLNIFAVDSKVKHIYLREIRISMEPDRFVVISPKDFIKAIRSQETSKFENYKLHRWAAWFMGAEAVKVGLKAVFSGHE